MKTPFKIIAIAIFLLPVFLTGCSESPPTQPDNYISGYITFYNSALDGNRGYAILITQVTQRRGSTLRSHSYEGFLVYPSTSRHIDNLIDGGTLFPGGDDVTIYFESAYQPEPGNPLFQTSVTLTVNGTQNIHVKGHDGTYVIGGN